jgi:hypothetical protein
LSGRGAVSEVKRKDCREVTGMGTCQREWMGILTSEPHANFYPKRDGGIWNRGIWNRRKRKWR